MRTIVHVVRRLILLAVLAGAAPAAAQVTTAVISGYVLDPSGQPIPNAEVALSDGSRGISRQASTDAAGFYRFADLEPSEYAIAASAPGFASRRETAVRVGVDSQIRLDVRLALAGLTETVDVVRHVGAERSESGDLGTIIDRARMEVLPLNRRDFLQLALLTPGVAPPVEGSELAARNGFAMHANGGREEFNNFLLDGVDNNDPYVNRYVVQPPVDSIEQFKIATNSYSAQYGRNAAGQVNVVTRGGTNDVHLFAYEYFRDAALDARNYFDGETKPTYARNQFGFGAGGPIVRDRAFLFGSLDLLREQQGLSRLATVPSMDVRGGNLSSLGATIVDPFTRRPFTENVVPPERISPVALKIMSLFPPPNRPGVGGNYLYNAVARDDETQVHLRFDERLQTSDLLTVRYNHGLTDAFEPYAEDTASLPGFGDYVHDPAENAMVRYQRVIGARSMNSLRFGFNRFRRELRPENYRTDVGQAWHVNWLNLRARDFGYPIVNVAGFSRLGDALSLPIIRETETFQLGDDLTLSRGNHLLQFGGDVRHTRLDGNLDMLVRGSLSFSGMISGSGLSDLLLGLPSFGLQSAADNPMHLRQTTVAGYVQDDWRLSPALTVNLGVRYEYTAPPVDPDNAMSALDVLSGRLVGVGTGSVPRSGVNADRNNIAPRVGMAWSATTDLMVRAGYGMYYDSGMLQVYTAQYFNPPQFTMRVFFPSQYSLLTLNDPFPTNGGYVPPASLSVLSPSLVSPLMQHWNVTAERTFRAIGTATIGYAGSRGSHLIRPRDLNQPAPAPGDVQERRPYPAFGSIFFVESAGRSTYHSLQGSFNRPFTNRVSLWAIYTLSTSMDDGSAFLDAKGDMNFPQDSRNMAAQWGPSSFDVRHRFSTAFVVALPGQNVVTRNTELRGIVTLQSGQPFTPILRFDNSNTGNGNQQAGWDHPDLVGDPSVARPTAERWFNTAAFAVPPQYTFGNAGRNILRGPGYASIDTSLARRFPLRAGAIDFELQAFNLLNRTNFELPELYADEPATFGRIFAAKPARQVQLVLRFTF